MPDMTLYFLSDDGAQAETLEQDLKQGLERLNSIEAATTSIPDSRFSGAEILAAVVLAATVIKELRAASSDLAAIAANLKTFFADVSDLAKKLGLKAYINVGLKKKSVEALSEDDFEKIAKATPVAPAS